MKEVKRLLVFFVVGILLFSLAPIVAQSETDVGQGVTDATTASKIAGTYEEYETDYQQRYEAYGGEIKFDVSPGIKPDNALYFIDNFFERPGNNPKKALNYKEEKIAEAVAMVNEGKPEEARQVLEKALDYSDIVEREVTPELEKRIDESSIRVQYVLKEIEEQVSGDEWKEVKEKIDDNFETEGKLRTAAKIVAKINELCAQLALLDPVQYEDTCKIKDNSPKWMKTQFQQLTKEQQKEAKEFGQIITQCFQTSGKQCRCDDISFYEFSVFCKKMSSLSVKCDEGDENSCVEMQEAEMPELPEHLKIIFNEIQGGIGKAKFEKNMPEECSSVGATPEKCTLIMTEINSPPECRTAIKEAAERGELKGELDGNKLCHEIMFKLHAPQECINAGATTPDECAKIMFKTNMPQQCIDAGFDGQYASDEKNCKELMNKGQYYGGGGCMNIIDERERAKCFEGAMVVINDVYGMRPEVDKSALTWQCQENRIFNSADCDRFMREIWPKMEQQRREEAQKSLEQRQVYVEYAQGGQKCPDGICDYAEQNGFAYCPEDCGGVRTNTCGYNCWLEEGSCVCKTTPVYGQDCGYNCWWNSGFNKCECGTTPTGGQSCGYNCWWQTDHCECGNVQPTYKDCGYGCWWDSGMNSCKCAPVPTTPTGQACGGYNCWWQTDHCECSMGCQCSWGWSDSCNCQSAPIGAGCQCSCGWSPTCNCGSFCSTTCGSGCWWNSGLNRCDCETTTGGVCSSKGGTCCTACSSAGPYISGTECNCCGECQTTPTGYCGDGACNAGETVSSCSSDCGTITTDPCPSDACPNICCETTTGGVCSSKGGICCSVCSGGSYISGTECNCCGTCETTTGGGCTSTSCGAGYYCGASGTCMPSSTCGNGACDGGETTSCPSDCGLTAPADPCASCSCSSCGTECHGTDGSLCCSAPACEEPPITGGVFWNYYYNK